MQRCIFSEFFFYKYDQSQLLFPFYVSVVNTVRFLFWSLFLLHPCKLLSNILHANILDVIQMFSQWQTMLSP